MATIPKRQIRETYCHVKRFVIITLVYYHSPFVDGNSISNMILVPVMVIVSQFLIGYRLDIESALLDEKGTGGRS
jgi:hypothetical protein